MVPLALQLWYSDGNAIRSSAPGNPCLAGCRQSGGGPTACSGNGANVVNNILTAECDGTDYQNWDWKVRAAVQPTATVFQALWGFGNNCQRTDL